MTDRITHFHVEGFRSCRDVTLDGLGEITAFVGRNGVGKSNILKAIESAARTATTPYQGVIRVGGRKAEFQFLIKNKAYRFVQNIAFRRVDNEKKASSLSIHETLETGDKSGWKKLIIRDNESMVVDAWDEPIQIGLQMPCLQAVFSLFPNSNPVAKVVKKIIQFFDGIRYFPLDETSKPSNTCDANPLISDKEYQAWIATLNSPTCSFDSVCLQILHLSLTKPAKYDELMSLLGKTGLGLIEGIEIHSFSLRPSSKKESSDIHHVLSFSLCSQSGAGTRNSYSFADLSVGTRRIVRLLVSVLSGNTSVSLIEHPEDAIHSGMVKKLMGILRVNCDTRQLLIASHSPQVFNILSPDQIRFVWMESGGTAIRSLTSSELQSASDFMCNDGPLSDFLDSIQDN